MSQNHKEPEEIDLTIDSDEKDTDEDEIESTVSESETHVESEISSEDNVNGETCERRIGKPPISFLSSQESASIGETTEIEEDLDEEEKSGDDSELRDESSSLETSSLCTNDEEVLTALEITNTAESEASETESTSSLESRIVENDWSDFEISEPITASIESQESSIAENYDLAMKAFANGHLDDAFRRFLELSKNPVLVQQQVADFRNFDWAKAKKDYRPANLTILKQYFFAVHRNLAKFMRDPTLNYLHALTVKPDDKSLWFEFGVESVNRLNLNAAEFAFEEYGNGPKCWELLLRACFATKKFHKCTKYLQKIYATNPENLLAKVVKLEIKKINPFWAKIIEGIFPEPGFGLGPPKKDVISKKEYSKILSELQDFAQNSKTYVKPPERVPPTPVVVQLSPSISFEDLAVTLCDLFDRIESFSIFSEQRIIFNKEKPKKSKTVVLNSPTLVASSISSTSTNEKTNSSSDSMPLSISIPEVVDTELAGSQPCSLKDLRIAQTSMEYESNVLESMEDSIDVWSVVDNLVNQVVKNEKNEAGTARNVKIKSTNKSIKKIVAEESKKTRRGKNRSMLDELFDSHVNYEQMPKKRAWELSDYMFMEKSKDDACMLNYENRLGFPSRNMLGVAPEKSVKAPQKIGTKISEEPAAINEEISVEPFVKQLLEEHENFLIEELLHNFCKFVAIECPKSQLSSEQKKIFSQVYIRWANSFCNLSSLHYSDVSKIAIHVFAAEMGCHCAFQICMQILGGPDAFDRLVERLFLNDLTRAPPIKKLRLDEELKKAEQILATYREDQNIDDLVDCEPESEPIEDMEIEPFPTKSLTVSSAYDVIRRLCEKIQQEE
uniref:Uncharacterized protein n=1 Tax=Acrobeloides nanus TaxID=290746 RepID=A0A914CDR2_9BILA